MATDCRLCIRFDMCYPTQEGYKPCFAYEPKKLTNGDRIRLMIDEDLAAYLNVMQSNAYHGGRFNHMNNVYPHNHDEWLKWLKEEY